jgi:hypothetical protein
VKITHPLGGKSLAELKSLEGAFWVGESTQSEQQTISRLHERGRSNRWIIDFVANKIGTSCGWQFITNTI